MKFTQVLLCLVLAHIANVASGPVNIVHHQNPSCERSMKENGLTGRFAGAVAHGIHSITLEDIKYYFKSNATEQNNIPTVNYDLSENAALILPHAKLYGYDISFKTISMRHLDQVLKNMDKRDWSLANYSPLEKVAHVFHMSEVWARTKVHYDAISLLGYKSDVCACVKDIHSNGIVQLLNLMSLKIRYPGITSGTYNEDGLKGYHFHSGSPSEKTEDEENLKGYRFKYPGSTSENDEDDENKRYHFGYHFGGHNNLNEDGQNLKRYHYKFPKSTSEKKDEEKLKRYHFGYHFGGQNNLNEDGQNLKRYHYKFPAGSTFENDGDDENPKRYHFGYHFGGHNNLSSTLQNFDFNGNTEDVKKRVSEQLVDGDDGIEPLVGEKSWKVWKSIMKSMVAHDDYELAMFLYCMLN